MKIIVSGMVAGDPHQGGATWAVAQYVLGLRRLGHDVLLVEPLPSSPRAEIRSYFDAVCSGFDMIDRAALLVAGTTETVGAHYDEILRFARDADLLLNFAGMLTDSEVLAEVPCRVYIDLDPAFTQLWHHVEGIDMRFDDHTHFVTVGLDIGGRSDVPTCGREWQTTLPPVVLAEWPPADRITHEAFTTVANWRGYGSIEHRGVKFGQKAHSLREVIDLPTRTSAVFLLALGIDPAETVDLAALDVNGWHLVSPAAVTATPDSYRRFIRGSRAEFGIAKSGYVLSHSGWFSDRSACYLASGRPVVAQDTGFSAHLDVGTGLVPFEDAASAAAGVDSIRASYSRHAVAARELAEEYLDSDRVLRTLLERVGGC